MDLGYPDKMESFGKGPSLSAGGLCSDAATQD